MGSAGGGPLIALTNARLGGRSGRYSESRLTQRQTALPIHQHWVCVGARLAIEDHHTQPLWRKVSIAPCEQGQHHRPEVAPAVGEYVFVTRWPFVVETPLKKSGAHELVESPRQHVGRNPQTFLELIETRHTGQSIPEYQDAPPIADPIEAAGNRTLRVSDTLSLHGALSFSTLVTCIMIVTTNKLSS